MEYDGFGFGWVNLKLPFVKETLNGVKVRLKIVP